MSYLIHLVIILVSIWMAKEAALQIIITTATITIALMVIVKIARMIEHVQGRRAKMKRLLKKIAEPFVTIWDGAAMIAGMTFMQFFPL